MALKPPVSNDTDHIQGLKRATIELVEYGDYQCPHCGRAYPIIKRIQEKFKDDLKFVFRNFPLSEIHPQAIQAAAAAEAAGRQEKYWEMHDIIFENQHNLAKPALLEFATKLGLDLRKFEVDLSDQSIIEKIESDFESGVRSGVNGTPTFFVNGTKYVDSWDEWELSRNLNVLLARG